MVGVGCVPCLHNGEILSGHDQGLPLPHELLLFTHESQLLIDVGELLLEGLFLLVWSNILQTLVFIHALHLY